MTQPDGADTLAQLRQRIAGAVDGVFEQWIDGLDGQRPQDALTAAVLAAVQPEMDALAEVRGLLADLTDPDPCWFDHHGYCQAHGWMATEPACPHARAKALNAPSPPAP